MYRAASILATPRGMAGNEKDRKDSRLVQDPGKTPGKAEGDRDSGSDKRPSDGLWPRETIK
jgi:hypothetical protein